MLGIFSNETVTDFHITLNHMANFRIKRRVDLIFSENTWRPGATTRTFKHESFMTSSLDFLSILAENQGADYKHLPPKLLG